jgi:tRNA threonylcarbamoyladenosine modification (KEOPS) complex  Pcc1 subunit
MTKTKIFVASDPKSPYTNLHPFYQGLVESTDITLYHPTELSELTKDFTGVVEHEIAKRDMLKILESDLVLFDYDVNPPIAWLIYGNVSPVSQTIVISRSQTNIDPMIGRNIRAVIKAEDVTGFIAFLLASKRNLSSSEDKLDPSPSEE